MIEILQGTPGSGKSAVAMTLLVNHLVDGGAVAANFDLVPHWAWMLAGCNYKVRLGLRDRIDQAEILRSRCFKIGSPETVFLASEKLKTCGLSAKYKSKREGKGLLIIDEAQLVFNTRDYSKNMRWIEFFTQHRKLGWDVLLIAHYIQMIDKQIRPLIEIESRFRNLKKLRLPIIPIPMSPINAFLVVRFYAGIAAGAGMKHSMSLNFLDMTVANLYDTLNVFAFDQAIESMIYQGVDPRISAQSLPNYTPDYFLGRKFAVWKAKHAKAKTQGRITRQPQTAPLKGSISTARRAGAVRDYY